MTLPKPQSDALIAAADLVRRAGARSFEIGYLDDDADNPRWWAQADCGSDRIIVEDFKTPIIAAEALARRILSGAKCKCGRLVSLQNSGAHFASNDWDEKVRMADGSTWTAKQAAEAGQCRWRRVGNKWRSGCES